LGGPAKLQRGDRVLLDSEAAELSVADAVFSVRDESERVGAAASSSSFVIKGSV
jgi:hypothetical protein